MKLPEYVDWVSLDLRIRISVVVVLVILFLMPFGFLHSYYIGEGAGGTLYWKGNEAFLFTSESHTGYHVSYLALPFVIIFQFYWAPAPADGWGCPLVIHVTPTNFDQHRGACGAPDDQPHFVTPFDNHFFAICQKAMLCRWTDDGYILATDKEMRRLDASTLPALARENNQDISGWRLHYYPDAGDRFEAQLTDGSLISMRNRAKSLHGFPWIVVELTRPGQKPQTLYDVNSFPRRVNKKQYITTFVTR